MALINEDFLRKNFKNKKEIILNKTDVLTPLAKDFISDKKIKIVYKEEKKTMAQNPENIEFRQQQKVKFKERVINEGTDQEQRYKFVTIYGTKLDYKPEHMTHLKGNTLVFKDHKQIKFRGQIDILESKILEVQIFAKNANKQKLVDDLQDMLIFVRCITRAEVLDLDIEPVNLLGLNEQQIREMSHDPKKFFNIGHEFPDYRMGDLVVHVNSIRAFVRQVEISAYEAFKNEYGDVSRNDIVQALNRLSSVCWIIMFKIRTSQYD